MLTEFLFTTGLYIVLRSCAGNILDSIKAAKHQRVRVSIVGLAAEVHICKVIAQVRFR